MNAVVLCAHCHARPVKAQKYCSKSCRRIVAQRAYEARQLRRGCCKVCGQPRDSESSYYCPRHRELNRLKQQRAYRRAHPP